MLATHIEVRSDVKDRDGLIDVRLVGEGAFRFQITPLMALELSSRLEAHAQRLLGSTPLPDDDAAGDERRTHFVQK